MKGIDLFHQHIFFTILYYIFVAVIYDIINIHIVVKMLLQSSQTGNDGYNLLPLYSGHCPAEHYKGYQISPEMCTVSSKDWDTNLTSHLFEIWQ